MSSATWLEVDVAVSCMVLVLDAQDVEAAVRVGHADVDLAVEAAEAAQRRRRARRRGWSPPSPPRATRA